MLPALTQGSRKMTCLVDRGNLVVHDQESDPLLIAEGKFQVGAQFGFVGYSGQFSCR